MTFTPSNTCGGEANLTSTAKSMSVGVAEVVIVTRVYWRAAQTMPYNYTSYGLPRMWKLRPNQPRSKCRLLQSQTTANNNCFRSVDAGVCCASSFDRESGPDARQLARYAPLVWVYFRTSSPMLQRPGWRHSDWLAERRANCSPQPVKSISETALAAARRPHGALPASNYYDENDWLQPITRWRLVGSP